jgi:V8-like Glu-specific endopeptidase
MTITRRNRIATAVVAALLCAAPAALSAFTTPAAPGVPATPGVPGAPGATPTAAAALSGSPARAQPQAAPAAGVVVHPSAVTVRQQLAVARYWTRARMASAIPLDTPAASLTRPPTARPAGTVGSAGTSGSPGTSGPDTSGSPAANAPSTTTSGPENTDGRGLRWVNGGAVTRTTGKVFFTLDGTDYVCSGSAVDSARADLVLTAAHCVTDGDGGWAANWTFVPGYSDGAEPYGAYTASRFYVSPQWTGGTAGGSGKAGGANNADEQYDAAFVAVNPATLRGAAPHVATMPATAPVTFGGGLTVPAGSAGSAGSSTGTTYVFGYPAESPFSGLYPNYCAGPARQSGTGVAAIRCDMTAGDSGGPWFAGFSTRTATGTIVAIGTFKYSDDMQVLYGTELGPAAHALYEQANVTSAR